MRLQAFFIFVPYAGQLHLPVASPLLFVKREEENKSAPEPVWARDKILRNAKAMHLWLNLLKPSGLFMYHKT